MRKLKNILVTGGYGFIGSNFINFLFNNSQCSKMNFCDFTGTVVNVDKLTYAANKENLKKIEDTYINKRYFFEYADICDKDRILYILKKYDIDTIVHFAAESHVDKSIENPSEFIQTNVLGTQNLLECATMYWNTACNNIRPDVIFHYISTDEVYGSLGKNGKFTEESPYNPSSPYSASKASGELLTYSYLKTFGLPVTISSCSNNYGPFQHKEKFIPLMINNILSSKPLPVYGSGLNVRDWIFVDDHNNAVWQILKKSKIGQKYNIGSNTELSNLELLNLIIEKACAIYRLKRTEIEKLIQFVKDRPGHDYRYAIDSSKLKKELNWKPQVSFDEGLEITVKVVNK